MNADAPSLLHRALRWSLPGAAVLSIPIGIILQERFMQAFLPSLSPWRFSAVPELVGVGIGMLCGITTLWTSKRALDRCMEGLKAREAIVLTLILMLPNLFVAALAGAFLICAFLSFPFFGPTAAVVLIGALVLRKFKAASLPHE